MTENKKSSVLIRDEKISHGLKKIPFAKIIAEEGWLPTQVDGKGDYGGGGILKFFRYRGRIICIDEFTDEIVVDNPFEDFIKVLTGLREHEGVIPELPIKEREERDINVGNEEKQDV